MSLRTKLLAAIVGLNAAILLLALALLLQSEAGRPTAPSPAVLADLIGLGGAFAGRPGTARERSLAVQRLEAVEGSGLVRDVLVVEEQEEGGHRVWRGSDYLQGEDPGGPELSPGEERRRAEQAFQQARRQAGGWTWVGGSVIAVVLPACSEAGGRRGLVALSPPRADPRRGVRGAYLVMVGGVILLTAVSFSLVSRLVIRPLAGLALAADRIGRGEFGVPVERRGTDDEIDRALAAFQGMAREIQEYQGHLEERVLSSLERIRKTEQHLAIAQRLAATGKLASGIAHEINNPLGGMRSAARALLRGDLPPEKTTQYLDLILDGLARIEETVKKFLSFTPRRVEPRPTDLADVARKAAALARHRLEKCGVRYGEDLPAPGTARVFGDPHELQQVALNLLLNAADATAGAKDARVDLRVRSRGEEVSLEVVDNGVGLSPEDQRCCFDLFFTTKSAGEGSGLGLAVAHTIVTNHGGRIEVESEVGKGATFRVVLPAEPSGEGAARRRDQGPGSGSPAPGTSG